MNTSSFMYSRGETLLSIENVTVTFKQPDTGKRVTVLRDVNADIRDINRPDMTQGQIIALLGPSGIGKTTLFRVMAGLLTPDTGTVKVGTNQREVCPGDVGVVAQHYPLLDHYTVLKNLIFAGRQAGMSTDDAEKKSKEYLTEFHLEDHANKYPIQLSGGQRQRVAIAQQLICSTHYIVMDEPFSGLDTVALARARNLMLSVSQHHEENTLIVVTHDVTTAVSIADTVWLMGRDRDDAGNVIPGARIMETLCLIDMGVCWHADPLETAAASGVIKYIKNRMMTL